jgi:hypothetical protein
VVGGGPGVYNGNDNSFPKSRTTPLEIVDALCSGPVVSIAGDAVNSLVWVLYHNNNGSPGTHGFIYHENLESFTQITGPGTSNNLGTKIVNYRSDLSSEVFFPGSSIRCLSVGTSTRLDYDKMVKSGFSQSVTRDAYLRWPFFNPTGEKKLARFIIKVDVLSISGVQKSWSVHGILKLGENTTSRDGWVTIDGCPYADKHSIGVSVLGVGDIDSPAPYMVNFVGIEVDYKEGPTRSI